MLIMASSAVTTRNELLRQSRKAIVKQCDSMKISHEGQKSQMIDRIISKLYPNESPNNNHHSRASITSSTSPYSQRELNRRQDIEKVVNSLTGTAPANTIDIVIKSYDDKADSEDIAWLQIIATLKSLHSKLHSEQQPHVQRQSGSSEVAVIKQLQSDKEQLTAIIKAKDEIINNAKAEIDGLKREIRRLKEEEEKEDLQLDKVQKQRARKLLQERVQYQQQHTLSTTTTADADGSKSASPKKTISELLNESGKEDAMDVIHSMGVIKFEYDRRQKRDTFNLDLTNNSVLRRLTNDQRKQFMFLLAHCLCDASGQQKIEKIKMTNLGVDDKLFPEFMDVLIENIGSFEAEEWWLESNKIGDAGMKKLALFLERVPRKKAIISTPVINELLRCIERNDVLQKFTFEWRLTQHRDRINKKLNANQEAKRKRKWAKKK